MTKCGEGWTIECEHGRRYSNSDKLPHYEVAATMRHSDQTNQNAVPGTEKDRSNLLVDLIQVRTGCNPKQCAVRLDGEGAYFSTRNNMHHVIAWYEKDNIVHAEDINKTYSFIDTVKHAFEYIAQAERKKHEHILEIDGDRLPVHVFPGEIFELDINLPGLYSQSIGRGIDAKKDPALLGRPDVNTLGGKKNPQSKKDEKLQEPKNRKKRLKKEMQRQAMQRIMEAGFFEKTENEIRTFGFRYDHSNRYDPLKLREKGAARETERENKGVSEAEKRLDKTVHALLSLPVILKRNDQVVRLSELESLVALIAISRRVLRLLHSIQDRVPRIGPYWEFKLDLLKIQMKLLWGFAELTDYEVTPFRALGADIVLVDAEFELGFGLKKGPLVAALFFCFKGKVEVNASWLEPCLPGREQSQLPEVTAILTPGCGAKISLGELLEATAIAECDFVITITFNPDYEGGPDEDLLGMSVSFKEMNFSAEIKVFEVGFVDFKQEQPTESVIYDGGLFKQEKDAPAAEGNAETFKNLLLKEGQAIRSGEKWDEDKCGFIVAQNEHIDDWALWGFELVPMETLVNDIILGIRAAIGSNYDRYFDFHPKTAEQLMQDIASRIIRSPDFVNPRGSTWFSYEGAISHTNFLRLLRNEIKSIAENYIDPTKYLRSQMS
jgi:hypothetical protein